MAHPPSVSLSRWWRPLRTGQNHELRHIKTVNFGIIEKLMHTKVAMHVTLKIELMKGIPGNERI